MHNRSLIKFFPLLYGILYVKKVAFEGATGKKYETQKKLCPLCVNICLQFFYRKIPKQKRSKDEKILTKFHCYMIFYPTSPFYFYLSCCTWLAVGIMQGSLTFLAAIYIFLLLFTSFFSICFSFSKK